MTGVLMGETSRVSNKTGARDEAEPSGIAVMHTALFIGLTICASAWTAMPRQYPF